VNHFGHQLSMSDTITPQLIGDDLPGLSLMTLQQPLEESLGRLAIPPGLKKDIDHFTVLINCSPQIALFAAYFHEDLVNEKSIAVTPMFTFQPLGVFGAELVAPQANRFVTDGDSSLCEYIFDISVAQIESIVEPDSITDDF